MPLTEAEVITARERVGVVESELRRLRVDKAAAESEHAMAQRAATDALYPKCRAHLAPLVDDLWRALAAAVDVQERIDAEMGRLNALLGARGSRGSGGRDCGSRSTRAVADERWASSAMGWAR